MITLYSKFIRGIRWNALESVLYHIIFLSHQIILFKVIDRSLYGLASTILATLYAIVMIGNLGLDPTFGPFFSTAKRNKGYFRLIVARQLVLQLIIFTLCALGVLTLRHYLLPDIIALDTPLLGILGILLISEGIKRSIRTLLQLAFMNHATTSIEVFTIATYVLMVWGWYSLRGYINLYTLLVPLLITSLTSVTLLIFCLYRWYKKLPQEPKSEISQGYLYSRIIKSRILSSIYITGQQLFSSNVLIPTIAMHSGLIEAGIFNLLATLSYSITSIFHKIGGYTTQAILSYIKDQELEVKRTAFSFISSELLHIIGAITTFLIINYQKVLFLNRQLLATDQWMLSAYLYLGIILSDYLVVAYEKFYLNEERADYLALFHIITIIACSLLLYFSASFSATLLLGALLAIRLISFFTLTLISFHYWGIKPHLKIRPWYVATTLFCSVLFFLLF